MPSHGFRAQSPAEGVTVVGESVRRVLAERAEFLVEVTTTAPSAAQALRDNHMKTAQLTQAVGALGVQQTEIQTISLRVNGIYSPTLPALSPYGGVPQIGPASYGGYSGLNAVQPEVQVGSYHAAHTFRVSVKDPGRLGEIIDSVARVGGSLAGGYSYRSNDDAAARRSALEAAAKDAREKAEALAAATGKQIGDAIAISEDIVASNGTYAALRTALPFAFGAGAPDFTGELEYYARVSATFRLQ